MKVKNKKRMFRSAKKSFFLNNFRKKILKKEQFEFLLI
jgi:hypothetical protein